MSGKNRLQGLDVKILVTCPPMLGEKAEFLLIFEEKGWQAICPDVIQVLDEAELCELLPQVDGWIVGDDPATSRVLTAGSEGRLKALVKWGIGTDNVDFPACKRLNLPVINTPMMFGNEVADIALGYVIGLSRKTFTIDREVRSGGWPKYQGISLKGKTVGVLGFGDIGSNLASRLVACGMRVYTWDPAIHSIDTGAAELVRWPSKIGDCDYLVLTCSLNEYNYHIIDADLLSQTKDAVRLVNVARGPLIDEAALIECLISGKVHSAALDVFEQEPLDISSQLRDFDHCIFGSHNASNTKEAVMRTTLKAIECMDSFLGA